MALVVSPAAGGCPATTLGGIRQTADTAIKLYDNPPAYVPPAQTGIASTALSADFKIFPNPVEGRLFVTLGELQSATRVEVLDAAGRKAAVPVQRTANGFTISTSALPRGLYAVRVIVADGHGASATFVKQ